MTSISLAPYSGAVDTPEELALALQAGGSPVTILAASYTGDQTAVAFCAAAIDGIGTVDGILLTSGDGTPPVSNSLGNYGVNNFGGSDAGLEEVIAGANPGPVIHTSDAAILEFTFTVPAGTASIRLDLIFASEDFPDRAATLADVAAVFVDGVNCALFDGSPSRPLDATAENVAAGIFFNNTGAPVAGATAIAVPLEYDGISKGLSLIAPLGEGEDGVHTIRIGIADSGDSWYDSGLFIGNMTASQATNGGLKILLPGTDNPETIAGGNEAELTYCYNGNDVFYGNGGDDVCFGNPGNDTLAGGDGVDNLLGGLGNDSLDGGDDADYLKGGVGNDSARGGLGDDTLKTGAGDDYLEGGDGNDVLSSSSGSDTFDGGAGSDTLGGGDDDDILSGGAGNDRFVFAHGGGDDTILDFATGDLIDLVDFNLEGIGQLGRSQVGGDVLIALPDGGSILLADTALATVGPADFVLL